MSVTPASLMSSSANEEILPPEVSARSESWLTRARNYPVFSRTWYRYRARAWMGTLIPALLLIFLIDAARGAHWRTFFVVWIPLALAGTGMHLGGAALAVWVRQRGYAEKKEWRSLITVLCAGLLCSLLLFFAARQATQQLLHYEAPMLTALKLHYSGSPDPAKTTAATPAGNWLSEFKAGFEQGLQDGSQNRAPRPPDTAGSDFWKGFYIGLVLSSVCIYLSGGYDLWLFSRQRNMLKVAQSKRASEQAQAMQRETELRLSVLAAQVEPHFLFNTLAGVRSAISTEPARAVAIVDHLVDYLRATIPQMRDDGGSVQSRLSKQLDAVHAYLSLMQARIPRLSFSVESQIADAAVPPLMLISLVENAIKHGIEPKVGAAHIAVKVSVIAIQEQPMLEMRVEDDGVGFGGHNSGSGIGLANIHQRLAAMYGDRASLLLKARPEGGVAAIITIPLEKQTEAA